MRKENLPESKNVVDTLPRSYPVADFLRDLYYTAVRARATVDPVYNDSLKEEDRQERLKMLDQDHAIEAARVRPISRLIQNQQQHLQDRSMVQEMARSLTGGSAPITSVGNLPGRYGYGHHPDPEEGGYNYHRLPAPDSYIKAASNLLFQKPFGKELPPNVQEYLNTLMQAIK